MEDRYFVENSTLDFLVPHETDVDIEHALNTAESPAGDEASVLARIPQRALLYFDEKLQIYAVLRTPYQDDHELQKYISRLSITVEAHAFSLPTIGSPSETNAASARDVIWASNLDISEDPVFAVVGSEEEDDAHDVLLIWKMEAFLNRPRVRLQSPAVMFKVSATLLPPLADKASVDEYLPSGLPLPSNVLAPLNDGQPQSSPGIFLSSSRLLPSVLPRGAPNTEALPLKIVSRRAFRAIPAASSRLRYYRSTTTAAKSSVTASLELDIPPFAQHAIEVTRIGLAYTGGKEQNVINSETLKLPETLSAKDSLVCLFALNPDEFPHNPISPTTQSIDVMVDARVEVAKSCRPQIQIRWRQTIDFAAVLNPTHAKGAGSLQRDNRPATLTNIALAKPGPADSLTRQTLLSSANISATFVGTKRIFVGVPFTWEVSIVNRSDRLRQFSMTMIPKRRNPDGGRNRLRSGSLPGSGSTTLADAVVDDNVLFATIKSQDVEPAQLTCLSPNAQTHALPPGAIYTTSLEFLPLKKGYLQMEAIRITDLETGDANEVRNLPDIVALEFESSG